MEGVRERPARPAPGSRLPDRTPFVKAIGSCCQEALGLRTTCRSRPREGALILVRIQAQLLDHVLVIRPVD